MKHELVEWLCIDLTFAWLYPRIIRIIMKHELVEWLCIDLIFTWLCIRTLVDMN